MIGRVVLLGSALVFAATPAPAATRSLTLAQAETAPAPPPVAMPGSTAGGKKTPAPSAPSPDATPPAPMPAAPMPAAPVPAAPAAPAAPVPLPPSATNPAPTSPPPAPNGPGPAPPASPPPAAPAPPAAPPLAPPIEPAPPGRSGSATAPPPPPPSAPPSAGPNALQPTPSLDFSPLVQAFSLVRDTAAYVSPSLDAPQMYPLRAGTPVMSAARSRDGSWVVALTEDGRAAYLRAEDLGPYDPSRAPRPDLPPTVSGEAQVIDTATLSIDGQRLSLAGVDGEGGEYARQLQSLINAQGRVVSCTLQARGYVCTLAGGMDIARAALYNGAARAADDASDDYRQQAQSARDAHRGIWR